MGQTWAHTDGESKIQWHCIRMKIKCWTGKYDGSAMGKLGFML